MSRCFPAKSTFLKFSNSDQILPTCINEIELPDNPEQNWRVGDPDVNAQLLYKGNIKKAFGYAVIFS
jgi:hypothetical protein